MKNWFCLAVIVAAFGVVGRMEVESLRRIDDTAKDVRGLAEVLRRTENVRLVEDVRLTAYVADEGSQTALNELPVVGWSAAVSRDLLHLLGRRIYIPDHGVRYVSDVTSKNITRTIDLLVPTVQHAKTFGSKTADVVILD